MVKIKFKKTRFYFNLIFGLFWIGLAIFYLSIDKNLRWLDYGYFIIGMLYILRFINDLIYQYLTISDGVIKKNYLFGYGIKIKKNEIGGIKKLGDIYILNTAEQQMKINTNLIEPHSLQELTTFLAAIQLKPEGENIL